MKIGKTMKGFARERKTAYSCIRNIITTMLDRIALKTHGTVLTCSMVKEVYTANAS